MEQQHPPILIYYTFKGLLQPIRYLYCYIDIPFYQIHLNRLEQSKKQLPPQLLQHLHSFKIQKDNLPALIHKNNLVYGQYSIIAYSCRNFAHTYLFGTTPHMRARVQELMQFYLAKQPLSKALLYKYIDFANKNNQEEIHKYGALLYKKIINQSQYHQAFCEYIEQQEPRNFVLSHITLLDFFFIESCTYMIGMFDHPKRVNPESIKKRQKISMNEEDEYIDHYLLIIKQYYQRMREQPFYKKHQQYLDSFSILSNLMTNQIKEGFHKMWVGNLKFIA